MSVGGGAVSWKWGIMRSGQGRKIVENSQWIMGQSGGLFVKCVITKDSFTNLNSGWEVQNFDD